MIDNLKLSQREVNSGRCQTRVPEGEWEGLCFQPPSLEYHQQGGITDKQFSPLSNDKSCGQRCLFGCYNIFLTVCYNIILTGEYIKNEVVEEGQVKPWTL